MRLRPTPRGPWQARISTEAEGMNGLRTFEGSSCGALAEAVVVILALAADPFTLTDPPEAAAPEAAGPLLDPARAPRFRPAPEQRPALERIHLHAALVAAGDLGMLAGPVPGGGSRSPSHAAYCASRCKARPGRAASPPRQCSLRPAG